MADDLMTSTSTRPGTSTPAKGRRRAQGEQLPPQGSVARTLFPVARALLGSPIPVAIACWDGSSLGPTDATATIAVRSPEAIRRIVWAPGEIGVARAFVTGDLDTSDDIVEVLRTLSGVEESRPWSMVDSAPSLLAATARVGALRPPLPPPDIEHRPRRVGVHTRRGDADSISHHYDVSNDFYAMVLGESMTYSCARFERPDTDLAAAQASKHEHVCRKLGLHETPGARLLDVGCGWGSMAIHATTHHDAEVVGITISEPQARLAQERVEAAGIADRVQIRLQDYRDLGGETFDAISSIGMFEHVGKARIREYFETLRGLLGPQGRLLNHAISSVGSSRLRRNSFVYRYVFPDGELIDVADTIHAMQSAGFEVRDVESLREHYARTLRHWIANLDHHWDDAVAEVGTPRARTWKLYMAGSVVGFEDGGNNVHQVLGVVPDVSGASGMPPVRPE